jgi:sugar lactone lactonase YvrE
MTVTGQADRGSAHLIEVRGNNQTGEPGAILPEPLVVRLVDQFDNPLVGEMVTATVRVGVAAFVSAAQPVADLRTNDQGEAAFTVQLGDTVTGGTLIEMTALAAEPVQFVATAEGAIAPLGNGLAVVDNDALLVLDTLRSRLLHVDPVSRTRTVVSSAAVGIGPLFSIPQELVRMGADSVIVGNGSPAAVLQVDLASGDRMVVSGCADFDFVNAACNTPVGTGDYSLGFPAALAREAPGSIIVGDGFVAETSASALIRVDAETGERSLVSGCAVFDVNAFTCIEEVGTGLSLGFPEALAIGASGTILVGDTGVRALLRVDPESGNRTVLSGCADATCSAVIGTGPPLGTIQALVVEAGGTLIVAEAGVPETDFKTRALLRIDPVSGNRTVLSGCADAACSTIVGTGPTFSLSFPDAITITADGALVVFDRGLAGGAVLRVDPVSGARHVLFLLQQ